MLKVSDHTVNIKCCSLLQGFSDKLTSIDDVMRLLSVLDTSRSCPRNADKRFRALSESHKGVFKDRRGKHGNVYVIVSYLYLLFVCRRNCCLQ